MHIVTCSVVHALYPLKEQLFQHLVEFYNRPNSLSRFWQEVAELTIIVIADIDGGFGPQHYRLLHSTSLVNLPALVRCHPLYIRLRVRRELCFW